jgi:AraC-like DNA-binding protein
MLRVLFATVPKELRHGVASIWSLRGAAGSSRDWLLPNVSLGSLAWIRSGEVEVRGEGGWERAPERWLLGSLGRGREIRYRGELEVVGLELSASCACLLHTSGRSLCNLSGGWAPRDGLQGLEAGARSEDLRSLDAVAAQLAASFKCRCDSRLRRAVERLVANPNVRVQAVARELGWSERQLGRRVRDAIGTCPCELRRRARFSVACAEAARKAPATWAALAARAGYSDQAHLAREFRAYAGAPATTVFAPDWYGARTALSDSCKARSGQRVTPDA